MGMERFFSPNYLYPPRVGDRVQLGSNGRRGVVRSRGGDFAFVHFDDDPDDREYFLAWSRLQPERSETAQE